MSGNGLKERDGNLLSFYQNWLIVPLPSIPPFSLQPKHRHTKSCPWWTFTHSCEHKLSKEVLNSLQLHPRLLCQATLRDLLPPYLSRNHFPDHCCILKKKIIFLITAVSFLKKKKLHVKPMLLIYWSMAHILSLSICRSVFVYIGTRTELMQSFRAAEKNTVHLPCLKSLKNLTNNSNEGQWVTSE